MRSAPTLKIWITPFASVAMLEKLALLKIAFCRAPVLSRVSWRRTSVMPSAVSAVGVRMAGSWGGLGMADPWFSADWSGGSRGQRCEQHLRYLYAHPAQENACFCLQAPVGQIGSVDEFLG